jgi:hypothetical protein
MSLPGLANNAGSLKIAVELCTESLVNESRSPTARPGQRSRLSADDWSVPLSIRAISASSGEAEDEQARRLHCPGYVRDDEAEDWVAVMATMAATSGSPAHSCPWQRSSGY